MVVREERCYRETEEEGRKLRKLYPCTSFLLWLLAFPNSGLTAVGSKGGIPSAWSFS